MKILAGEKASNWKDAVGLAFQVVGVEVMSADIVDMLASLSAADKNTGEADKIIGTTVKSRYGSKATWRAERWSTGLLLPRMPKTLPSAAAASWMAASSTGWISTA